MMGDNLNQIQKSLKKSDKETDEHVELAPVDVSTKTEDLDNTTSDELTNFTDSKMAVMMVCADSAATESGSNCGIVEVIREVAMSTTGKAIVVEEACNLVTVVLGPNILPSPGSDVVALVTLARQVIGTVRMQYTTRSSANA